MMLSLLVAAKLKLSIALRGSILSPTCLLLCFFVKLSLSTNWFHETFDYTAHGVRLFLFQLSRIVFDPPANDRENDAGGVGRWERAIRLLRQCVGTRTAVEDGVNYHLFSMTAL